MFSTTDSIHHLVVLPFALSLSSSPSLAFFPSLSRGRPLPAGDWARLLKSEAGYNVVRVDVELYGEGGGGKGGGAERVSASAFVSDPALRIIVPSGDPREPKPTARYLNLIQQGVHYHTLDEGYREWLRSLDTVQRVPREYLDTRRDRRAKAGVLAVLASLLAAYISSL